ncbi:hypothetical protein SODALDRAFT_295028 [Sodiomyces alkalinus F11]|uniref:Cytochrome c oxidase subunit VIb n=1 Tax=Sodiomyces alkalinus (strain CBS 110278 / VKM F-3762 / F11) TaxID=1314773 RepID=A0A3N2PV61_SODAK|nr:hypothetical protein SODALDRAFT_295028 [Sodiomyces alkalinus F11]ROT38368.1 hypothetical protein SODALDRAFT_295028 [Sodiomyces alkalinus F11]
MGLFDPFKSPEAKRAEEVRAGAVAPDRRERAKCWEARDAYFACLDRVGVIDALKDDKQARKGCPAENAAFERDCAAAWVKYFKQWRVADIQKKARIAQLEAEGAVQIELTPTFEEAASGDSGSSGVPKGTSKEEIQQLLAKKRG